MSYARFSNESDVYVFPHVGGLIQCCACALGDDWDFNSPAEIVDHLREHIEAGHKIPAELLNENLYGPEDFVAMCSVHMCRKDTGHDGEHTPTTEQHQRIRDRLL